MKRIIIFILIVSFSLIAYAIEIEPGNVSGIWSVENSPYQILGDLQVNIDDTLSITPGCLIEFQGHYSIEISGVLTAIGTSESPIVFTISDTTGFSDMNSEAGGWHGIRFYNSDYGVDVSSLRFCEFSYGKAIGETEADKSGGAIYGSVNSKLSISFCNFENNIASNGGAIACNDAYNHQNIQNSRFINNKAIRENNNYGYGGAIYLKETSYVDLFNNMVIFNTAYDGGGYYGDLSSLMIYNNTIVENTSSSGGAGINTTNYFNIQNTILRDNTANDTIANHSGSGYFLNCNIEGSYGDSDAIDCIDIDPLFLGSGDNPYSLQENSYCIDEGFAYDYIYNQLDLIGNPRVFGGLEGIPDIGAFEFQGVANHLMKPIFSHNESSYISRIELELSSEMDDVQIYYTLDGTDPDSASDLYIEPIEIDYDTTVKAIAYKAGWNPSNISVANYEIGHLSGNISGTLYARSQPYIVEYGISVHSSHELIIEPGVTLLFTGDYNFVVHGDLFAEGVDNNPIVFTMADTTGFSSNTTDEGGWGGLKIQAEDDKTVLMKNCIIEYAKNLEGNYTSARGGGFDLSSSADIRIENCIIQHCKANYGGAIELRSGGATVIGNIIRNNYADNSGGGLHLDSYSDQFFIMNNIIEDNVSDYGSAISASYCNSVLFNNTIVDNISSTNSLISIGWEGEINLVNSIIWRSQGSENLFTIGSNTILNIYNCNIKGGLDSFVFGGGATYNGIYQNNISVEPGFSWEEDNPYSLTADSYCVNSGLADMSEFYLPEFDFNGNPRIFSGSNEIIDIGAYEYQGESSIVAKPLFSLESGFQETPQELELSCVTQNSSIYYTFDGSEPDQNSTLYTAPISVSSSEDVRAKAFSEGFTPSLTAKLSLVFGTLISGDFNGTLTLENSPYVITDSLHIQEGSSLIIEAGVKILGTENSGINVYGSIRAIGTEMDSIHFISLQENGRWGGFRFDSPNTNESSQFDYCRFENASKLDEDSGFGGAIYSMSYDDLSFNNCFFINNHASRGGAVYFGDSDISFDYCNFTRNGAFNNGGAIAGHSSSPQIENCFFTYNNAGWAGALDSYYCFGTIKNNTFGFNTANMGGAGKIDGAHPEIQNNLFYRNKASNDGCALYLDDFGVSEIVNCTFGGNYGTNNYYASTVYCVETSSPQFINCIFWDTSYTEVEAITSFHPCYPSYTNCTGKVQAQVINPLFVASLENDFHLLEGSPAIDTGLNNPIGVDILPWDLDFNQRIWDGDNDGVATIDIGVYEFGSESVDSEDPVIEVPEKYALSNYPNPFNPETTIRFSIPKQGNVTVSVFNIKGQKIKTILNEKHEPGNYSLKWNGVDEAGNSVSSGIYFYKLSLDGKSQKIKKMMLLK